MLFAFSNQQRSRARSKSARMKSRPARPLLPIVSLISGIELNVIFICLSFRTCKLLQLPWIPSLKLKRASEGDFCLLDWNRILCPQISPVNFLKHLVIASLYAAFVSLSVEKILTWNTDGTENIWSFIKFLFSFPKPRGFLCQNVAVVNSNLCVSKIFISG